MCAKGQWGRWNAAGPVDSTFPVKWEITAEAEEAYRAVITVHKDKLPLSGLKVSKATLYFPRSESGAFTVCFVDANQQVTKDSFDGGVGALPYDLTEFIKSSQNTLTFCLEPDKQQGTQYGTSFHAVGSLAPFVNIDDLADENTQSIRESLPLLDRR